MILASHGIIASQIASFDADAVAFFQRVSDATGTLSLTEKQAVNQLVLDLKANSLWTPMKAVYPMVGASAAACAQNLKSSSFTGSFSSTGWTFASTGVTGNAVSSTFNTNLNPFNDLASSNSNHQSIYVRNTTNGTYVDIGQIDFNWLTTVSFTTLGYFCYNPNNTNTLNQSAGTFTNLSINTRRSSTDLTYFKNNSKIQTTTNNNSAAFTNGNVHIGSAGGVSYFTDRQYAFASIGDGLTDTQASNLYTAVQAFQTTLSRQV
jgi:hypothetical protein